MLRDEIARRGPIPFSRFMETALYASGAGYYSRERDPFGRDGDFYTAAQVQPVFGRLIASALSRLAPSRIVDWGGGRGEMREELSSVAQYLLVDRHSEPPEPAPRTAIFANELFDALPVDVACRDERGDWREMAVACEADRFVWAPGKPLEGEWLECALEIARPLPDGEKISIELPVSYGVTLERMSRAAPEGILLVIDYGYTSREILRFPNGSLMSYRRHQAADDVLSQPGERDITAHVPWAWLESAAVQCGWRRKSFESLSSFLMRTGEADQFKAALAGASEKHTLQLKTLLFGMGESFQVMMLEREKTLP
jgi:SAM-dependent MidA family methyltransferase